MRLGTAFAYLILALGIIGVVHSSWLDWGQGVTGVRLQAAAPGEGGWSVDGVEPGSPGEASGLRVGDQVLRVSDGWGRSAVPGQARTRTAIELALRPGDRIVFELGGAGARTVSVIAVPFRAFELGALAWGTPLVGLAVRLLYLGVGAALILLRPKDPRSLLLGMFCIAVPQLSFPTLAMPHGLREATWILSVARNALIFTAIAHFALIFPERLLGPRTHKIALAALYAAFVPVALSHGSFVSASAFGAADVVETRGMASVLRNYTLFYLATAWTLAALLLVVQYRRAATDDGRRRLRVVLLGFGATFLVCLAVGLSIFFFVSAPAASRLASSRLLELALLLVLSIFPLTVAWAVVRHRMFDVRVIVRRGLRYALARRVLLSVLAIPLIAFVYALAGSSAQQQSVPRSLAMMVPLAALLVGAALYRDRILNRLDRSFFREAYDARQILLGLADRMRLARDSEVLGHDLERSASEALHPTFARLHVASGCDAFPPQVTMLLSDVGRALVLDDDSRHARLLPAEARQAARASGAELLAPLRGREGDLLGVLALGPKRSGEPYSHEDLDLVATAGRQYAAAYENLRLEREVRTTREAEQRLRGEIEMAREVQARLLPDRPPLVPGGDIFGVCRPARIVGGDYFDFIPMADGRLGIAVADVSGKGLAAAMLMSNLQAGLRTAVAAGVEIGGALRAVNALLCDLTSDNRFASFFFGVYDPAAGSLHYLNAGHNAPLLVRRSVGKTERLAPTAPILGVFVDWTGSERRIDLEPGDVLVVYTDGLSETTDADDREFGEAGVGAAASRSAAEGAGAGTVAQDMLAAVDRFAAGRPPADDLTLVVLRRT
jgi:sigma-B regulation protein RsbU (phosphoserine phosphatase)